MADKSDLFSLSCTELSLDSNTIAFSPAPCKKAFRLVLWGLALGIFTIHIGVLDLLLPAAGAAAMALGFRMLRQESRYFLLCFIISVLRTVYGFLLMILNATIYVQPFFTETLPGKILTVLHLIAPFALFFCLWKALCALREKAGLASGAKSALLLLLWYAVSLVLALLGTSGIPALLMIALYPLYLFSLWSLFSQLWEAGYAISPAPVKISAKLAAIVLSILLIVLSLLGVLFGGQYAMRWETFSQIRSEEAAEIEERLCSLGYPQELLCDLSDEELMLCEKAESVFFEQKRYKTRAGISQNETAPVLRVSLASVKCGNEYLLFQHFLWENDPEYFGTEAIASWAGMNGTADLTIEGELCGRILYDSLAGETLASPMESLERFTDRDGEKALAAFSLPKEGTRRRGVLLWRISAPQGMDFPGFALNLHYCRTYTAMQYPVITAREKLISHPSVYENNAFETCYFAFLYYNRS